MDAIESLVDERRAAWRKAGENLPAGASDLWGIALSGGGIRSATFCLGLLRSLAASGALRRFDVMSTVSGGGYAGTVLGKLLHNAGDAAGVTRVHDALAEAETRWFTWWLRANGRYLIPRGVKDRLFAVALFIRNLIGVHAEFGVAALFLAACTAAVNLLVWQGLSIELGVTEQWLSPDVIEWLPTLWLAAAIPAFLALESCCEYWAVSTALETSAWARFKAALFWLVLVAALAVAHPSRDPLATFAWPPAYWLVWAALLVLATAWIAALAIMPARVGKARRETRDPEHVRTLLRNRVTEILARRVALIFAILGIGLIDRLGWFVAFERSMHQGWYGAALLFVAAVLRYLLPKLTPASGTARPSVGVPLLLLGQALGWLLTLALAIWWVSIGYALVFDGFGPGSEQGIGQGIYRVALLAGITGLYLLLTGNNVGFLNASSLHGFYRARLTRSYLGAANDSRVVPQDGRPVAGAGGVLSPLPSEPPGGYRIHDVSDVLADDDVAMRAYQPHAGGGLVHLINVCLNETRDPRGGLFNQDRRGRPLTLGPGGLARIGLRPWGHLSAEGERTLGTWVAVSGAAFSPGMGSMTRPGLSALTALTGMRLGFWWRRTGFRDGPMPAAGQPEPLPATLRPRRLFAKTRLLAREILGRFGEDSSDWYLSDGGHFENTGAYTLLSAQAALILVADCGADPGYRFADLENLVRKARIDLGAEITFLRPKGPNPDPKLAAFGSLGDLKLESSIACLALARVRYRPGGARPDGILIVVKPNLSADVPVDLHNFKADHPDFPQQPTTDQFFSEAQWESYFTLGKVLGGKLTREVLDDIADVADRCFEKDDGQTVGLGSAPAASAATAAAAPSGAAGHEAAAPSRLPARLAGATVAAASLSAGAAISLGVATWQAIDSVQAERSAKVERDRAVLKELGDHYGKLGTPPSVDASLPAVASTLLRISSVHCQAESVGWFHSTPSAVCMLRQAKYLCRTRTDRMPACASLVASSSANCLDPDFMRVASIGPKYWAVDVQTTPEISCAPVALEGPRRGTPPAATASGPAGATAAGTVAGAATTGTAAGAATTGTAAGAATTGTAAGAATGALTGAATPASDATPASTPATTQAPGDAEVQGGACSTYTVYTQIYGGRQRPIVRGLREPWRELGASVPAIDDVVARAAREDRKPPRPYPVTTVLYPDDDAERCAHALATAGEKYAAALKPEPGASAPAGEPRWDVRELPAGLQASPNVIEVWIAPSWGSGRIADPRPDGG